MRVEDEDRKTKEDEDYKKRTDEVRTRGQNMGK
jgi:hypothetical protein